MSRFTRDEFDVGSTINKLKDAYDGFDTQFVKSTKEVVTKIVAAHSVFVEKVGKYGTTGDGKGNAPQNAQGGHQEKREDSQIGGGPNDSLIEDKSEALHSVNEYYGKLKTLLGKIKTNEMYVKEKDTGVVQQKTEHSQDNLITPKDRLITALGFMPMITDDDIKLDNINELTEPQKFTRSHVKHIIKCLDSFKEFKSSYFPQLVKYKSQVESEISLQEKELIEKKTKLSSYQVNATESSSKPDETSGSSPSPISVYTDLKNEIKGIEEYMVFLRKKKSDYEGYISQFESNYEKLVKNLINLKTIVDEILLLKEEEAKFSQKPTFSMIELKDELGNRWDFKKDEITSGIKTESYGNGTKPSVTNASVFEKDYKTLIKDVNNLVSDLFTMYLEKYLHDMHKKVKYLNRAEQGIGSRLAAANASNEKLTEEDARQTRKYTNDMKHIQSMTEVIKKNDMIVEAAIYQLHEAVKAVSDSVKTYKDTHLLDDVKKVTLEDKCDDMVKRVTKVQQKLKDVYNNDISIMDIILDNQFMALYVLKLLQYGLLVGAIFLTEKIFSNMYMERVYANNGDPPDLMIMLSICVAIYTAFTLFLATVLFLIHLVVEKHGIRNFVINIDLIKKFFIDYAASTLLLFLLLSIICMYMQSKKYFRYKTEGLRAIRAFGDIIMSIAPVVFAVPYFAIF